MSVLSFWPAAQHSAAAQLNVKTRWDKRAAAGIMAAVISGFLTCVYGVL